MADDDNFDIDIYGDENADFVAEPQPQEDHKQQGTDDDTGIASQILEKSIPNAQANCVLGPSSDGTWTETPNYWSVALTARESPSSHRSRLGISAQPDMLRWRLLS